MQISQPCRKGKQCEIIYELLIIPNRRKRPDRKGELNDCNNHRDALLGIHFSTFVIVCNGRVNL